jgi:hypothetical protein
MKIRIAASLLAGMGALAAAVLAVPEPAYSHKPITTTILFKNEIAQIFQRKCFQCHSDNNLSMSLTTYTEARPWARAIREEILERKMPPWQAVSGYGHFANDISLNGREKEIILSWADGGAPSGVLKAEEAIPPVFVPPAPEWVAGAPDAVYPIGGGQLIAAGSKFEIKRFVVSTKLPAARRVRAIALKQGDRRVVRHAAFYDGATGKWLGAWTPWQTQSMPLAGIAVVLAPNATIAVEIGYSGAEADVTDKSELGLYFDAGTGAVANSASLAAPDAALAAGATEQRVRAQMTLSTETKIVALWPTPGPGARSIEVTATTPEGIVTPLLWIQDYRPEWRSPYVFSTPVSLPRGSRVIMTAYFDNPGETATLAKAQTWVLSTAAAANPKSDARVRSRKSERQ